MKELTKEEICDVLVNAGNYQRTIFSLYDVNIIEVTKFKNNIAIIVHYTTDVVSYKELYSLFRDYMSKYKAFINKDACYSAPLLNNVSAAHFELKFYV